MEEREYLIELYNIYEQLLTENQRNYFEYYYFEDYSLTEIAEVFSVSKSYASKVINNISVKLKKFENILSIYSSKESLKEIYNNIADEQIKKKIEKLI